MSIRQAHSPSSSEGLIGGAIVVVGFVVLIVVAAVDLIGSRWSPSSPPPGTTTAQGKEGSSSSAAPLRKDDSPSTPDIVKGPIEEPSTQDSILNPTIQLQDNQLSYPLIPDLDDTDAAKVEDMRTEVPLDHEQDSKQLEQTADVHEIPVESSQEWVSLSKPDDSLSPNDPNVQPETTLTSSSIHEHPQPEGLPSHEQETPLEFTSSTLIDAPNKLHESTTTIRSETSAPSTPEPDAHYAPIHTQSDTEKQIPDSNVEFGSISEILKPRTSISSLYDSSSNLRPRNSTSELSIKKKRGGSFIKKSGTLINKVFKNKDTSSSAGADSNQPSDLEHDADLKKKLTSPSRVSLGSIRSISGSIKKKIGKRSSNDLTGGTTAQDDEPHTEYSNSSKVGPDDAEPSLLKTMFKVRKPPT